MIHKQITLIVIDMQRSMKGPDDREKNNVGTLIHEMREASAITKVNA